MNWVLPPASFQDWCVSCVDRHAGHAGQPGCLWGLMCTGLRLDYNHIKVLNDWSLTQSILRTLTQDLLFLGCLLFSDKQKWAIFNSEWCKIAVLFIFRPITFFEVSLLAVSLGVRYQSGLCVQWADWSRMCYLATGTYGGVSNVTSSNEKHVSKLVEVMDWRRALSRRQITHCYRSVDIE